MIALNRDVEALLCGRANELRLLLDNCAAGRVTVVSSKPCLGVTSFLEVGARPALEREEYIVVSFREWPGRYFGTSLLEKVAAAIRQKDGSDFAVDGDDLPSLIQRGCRRKGRRIVLILDQFEDYLRCHTSADVTGAFDSELARLAQLMDCALLLFGLQDQALERFDRFRRLIPNLFGGHIQLGPLAPNDARLWMQKEADRRHLVLEPAAADALVASPAATSGSGVDPFLFAVGLHRLIDAEIRMRSGAIRTSTIAEYGGADGLILESLDLTLSELSTTHAELFFRWCNILIGAGGHRRSATEQVLTDYAGKLNRFALTLLPILTGKNLLRPVEVRGEIHYEIARDRMAPIIQHWWNRREAAIVARRRAAFRVTSISVAVGTIVAAYAAWLYLSLQK